MCKAEPVPKDTVLWVWQNTQKYCKVIYTRFSEEVRNVL